MRNLTSIVLLAILPMCAPAHAQTGPNCAPRELVVERLASKYEETRQSVGLGSNNTMVETFASETTGSWTILVTNAQGMTCLVASGQSFEQVNETLPPEGDNT